MNLILAGDACASRPVIWVESPTQTIYPSGLAYTAVGEATTPGMGSSHLSGACWYYPLFRMRPTSQMQSALFSSRRRIINAQS